MSPYGDYSLLNFEGFKKDINGNMTNIPTYKFTKPKNKPWSIDDSGINSSRWQAQVGIRYIF